MGKSQLRPALEHYQGILRTIIAIFILCALYSFREYSDIQFLNNMLDHREGKGLVYVTEVIVTLLIALVCALGLDRALVPFLKNLSSKPSIDIISGGIRYLYSNAKADILFSDIEKIKTEGEPIISVEIYTKSGQFIKIKEYTNMESLLEHFKQADVQFEKYNK